MSGTYALIHVRASASEKPPAHAGGIDLKFVYRLISKKDEAETSPF